MVSVLEEEMCIDWTGVIPYSIECPKCKRYSNLPEDKWKYVIPRTPEPLVDYHLCPRCERMWSILIPHKDCISVVINWVEPFPFKILCPLCQHYANLKPDEWQIYLPKDHDPKKDVHMCPQCRKLWRILRGHFEISGFCGEKSYEEKNGE